jgi:hypothetical protein
MWTKDRPNKVGWYWIIASKEEMGTILVVVPVGELGGQFNISFGDDMIEFDDPKMEIVKYWNGPIDEPGINPSIEVELGKVETLI